MCTADTLEINPANVATGRTHLNESELEDYEVGEDDFSVTLHKLLEEKRADRHDLNPNPSSQRTQVDQPIFDEIQG